ncbi:MAG: hypothetical protein ABSE62_06900 [Chthoniobacteraceae bacterium]
MESRPKLNPVESVIGRDTTPRAPLLIIRLVGTLGFFVLGNWLAYDATVRWGIGLTVFTPILDTVFKIPCYIIALIAGIAEIPTTLIGHWCIAIIDPKLMNPETSPPGIFIWINALPAALLWTWLWGCIWRRRNRKRIAKEKV